MTLYTENPYLSLLLLVLHPSCLDLWRPSGPRDPVGGCPDPVLPLQCTPGTVPPAGSHGNCTHVFCAEAGVSCPSWRGLFQRPAGSFPPVPLGPWLLVVNTELHSSPPCLWFGTFKSREQLRAQRVWEVCLHVKPWDQLSLPVRSPSSLSWRCGVRSSFPRGGHWAEGRQDALSRTVSPSLLLWASGSSRLRGEGANGGPSPTLHVCVCMYLCMCMCMYVCV